MKKGSLIGIIVVIVAIAGGLIGYNLWVNSQLQASTTITIEGSTTCLPIVSDCAEEYMELYSNTDIQVSGGGSSVGVKAAGEGTANIGMASRAIKSSEVELYPNLKVYGIAKDGIAVIVNENNAVTGLTKEQLVAVLKGETTSWDSLGGSGAVVVIGRDSNSGTRATFEEILDVEGDVVYNSEKTSNNDVATSVANTPGAIGYVGLGYVSTSGVKALPIGGVAASESTVADGSYLISRTLYIMTNGEPDMQVMNFINYIKGAEGQAIAAENGFVKLPAGYVDPSLQSFATASVAVVA